MALQFIIPRRPATNLPFLFPSCAELQPLFCKRHQSSYRRTKKRLRVKPDASFAPSSNQTHDHIIYNPPSSAPSVYHTPTKFLPPNDLRRKLRTDSQLEVVKEATSLPLMFKSASETSKILGEAEIEDMRRLRAKDPMTWSRGKLAKRFGCSPLFVGMVCEASPEKKLVQKQILDAIKSRWGNKRSIAREDRELRRELWAQDK